MFNGQNSVLWCNLRDAFGPEIAQMYKNIRSVGTISYANVEQRFEGHQSKWPEALFNEDAQIKYINPLVAPAAGKTPTSSYLSMMQGSKAEQRKWWLYNRFRYMDSKWGAGDAFSNIIELRGYAKGNITVTPYTDIYPTIKFGSYTVTERGSHGTPTTLVCPIDTLNDTEIHIYSAPQLASVGDLSALKVGRADFRAAVNLQSIVVGSSASGYTNENLTVLDVGNSPLLRVIDARNCTALTGALDFSGATNVEHVYLAGTAVSSVNLPIGGALKTLQLPATVTNLTVRSQPGITSFTMPDYSNITTLRIENCGSAIPVLDILDDIQANSRVRIIGFSLAVSTTDDVEDFFDYLDTMRGLDEAGNNLDTAVVAGSITGLGTITGAWMAQMNARYPNVTIGYEHITSVITYKSWDGSETLQTQTVTDGGNGTWSGSPTRESTAQYSYAFSGWSLDTDQYVADPNAVKSVIADRTVYATYTRTVRTYTVTWRNADNTTLETDTNVPYGTMPTYNGATPTYQGQTSTGWTPAVTTVTGNATYTAVYIPVYQCRFYNESTLLETVQVLQGSTAVYSGSTPVKTDWEFIGWDKPLTNIQAATDFYAQFRDARSPVIQYVEATMTDYFSDTATDIAPSAFYNRDSLESVTTSATTIGSMAFFSNRKLTHVDLTSTSEISIGSQAFDYSYLLESIIIRSNTVSNISEGKFGKTLLYFKLGCIYVPSALVNSYKSDLANESYANDSIMVMPISSYPISDYSTITDSWGQIVTKALSASSSRAYSYSDIKLLDLGEYGKVYMRVADKTAEGITFITYTTLRDAMNINTSSVTSPDIGWWGNSDMRAWMNEDLIGEMPSELSTAITAETKYTWTPNGANEETSDKIWLPSMYEACRTGGESKGPTYPEIYGSYYTSGSYNLPHTSGLPTSDLQTRTNSSNRYYRVFSESSYSTIYDASSYQYATTFGFSIKKQGDPWQLLLDSIDAGTYESDYAIGDAFPLEFEHGYVNMQIVAFDEDESHVTLLADRALTTTHSITSTYDWENGSLREWLNDTVIETLPQLISESIVPIKKYSLTYRNGARTEVMTTDSLWVPSMKEACLADGTLVEANGVQYESLRLARSKKRRRERDFVSWWLRSVTQGSTMTKVSESGNYTNGQGSGSVVIGFAL